MKKISRTHACPGGCGAEVAQSQLSCRADWFRLPGRIRNLINTAYRNRTQNPMSHARAIREAMDWYRDNPRVDTSQS